MFLTNLDTIVISLFLGSGIILVVLFGVLVSIRLRQKDSKTLLEMFFKLSAISLVSLLAYGFIIFFKWPGITDVLVFVFIIIINVFSYIRIFSVFRQFVSFWSVFIAIGLTIFNLGIFLIQALMEKNSLILLAGFLFLLIMINLHFLAISVLIKFQNGENYGK